MEVEMQPICRGPPICWRNGLKNTKFEYDSGFTFTSTQEIIPDKVTMNVVRRYDHNDRLVFLRAILRVTDSVTLKETRDYKKNTCTIMVNDQQETGTMVSYARRFGKDYFLGSPVERWLPLFWFHRSPVFQKDEGFLLASQFVGDGKKPLFWS